MTPATEGMSIKNKPTTTTTKNQALEIIKITGKRTADFFLFFLFFLTAIIRQRKRKNCCHSNKHNKKKLAPDEMFNLESLIDLVKTEQTKSWKVIKHRLCTSVFTENKCFTVASFIWRNIKYCTHVCPSDQASASFNTGSS